MLIPFTHWCCPVSFLYCCHHFRSPSKICMMVLQMLLWSVAWPNHNVFRHLIVAKIYSCRSKWLFILLRQNYAKSPSLSSSSSLAPSLFQLKVVTQSSDEIYNLLQDDLLVVALRISGIVMSVHSLMLSARHFYCCHHFRSTSTVICMMVLQSVTCPNHDIFRRLIVAGRYSCWPKWLLIFLRPDYAKSSSSSSSFSSSSVYWLFQLKGVA